MKTNGNMNKLSLFIFFCATAINAVAQKYEANCIISNNGKYVAIQSDSGLVVIQTSSNAKKLIKRSSFVDGSCFTSKNEKLFWRAHDSLFVGNIFHSQKIALGAIASCSYVSNEESEYLLFRPKGNLTTLVLYDLNNDYQISIANVDRFLIDAEHHTLFYQKGKQLCYKTLDRNDTEHIIWTEGTGALHGLLLSDFAISNDGNIAVFQIRQNTNQRNKISIWAYEKSTNKITEVVDDDVVTKKFGLEIDEGALRIGSRNGTIFFKLRDTNTFHRLSKSANVHVWSYTDWKLQSQQLVDRSLIHTYAASINLKSGFIYPLESDRQIWLDPASGPGIGFRLNDNYAIVSVWPYPSLIYDALNKRHPVVESYSLNEANWNTAVNQTDIYLVSLKNGEKTLIKRGFHLTTSNFPRFYIDNNSRYVVYYDQESTAYYSYNIATRQTIRITKNITTKWNGKKEYAKQVNLRQFNSPNLFYTVLSDPEKILVSDYYSDFWQLDIRGRIKPINLTRGIGRTREIEFREVKQAGVNYFFSGWDKDDDQLFYQSNNQAPIKQLTSRSFYCNFIKKAKQANVFVVNLESPSQSSSYYFTKDFKLYKPLYTDSSILKAPHFRSERIDWTSANGVKMNGNILKPANFNRHKKYPVIFTFYESDRTPRHRFPFSKFNSIDTTPPPLNEGIANSEYCLNHGYLFVHVNIQFQLGHTTKSISECINSAADYVSKLPYVDGKHLGICGHSFGGYGVDCVITHSHKFAAACSGAGPSDLVSRFAEPATDLEGYQGSSSIEWGQFRVGATPWSRPDLILENSPYFFADRVTTPVLLVANQADQRVPIYQDIEFFQALRRCGKRAWLLEYEETPVGLSHAIIDAQNSKDLGIRMMQFFDHYLLNKPAPVWMTKGIPATMENCTGYEFDKEIKTPGNGLVKDQNISPGQQKLARRKTYVDQSGNLRIKEK